MDHHRLPGGGSSPAPGAAIGHASEDAREPASSVTVGEILDRVTDGFFALDRQWRFTYVNARAERIFRRKRDRLIGRVIWDALPEDLTSRFRGEHEEAVSSGRVVMAEEHFAANDRWYEIRIYPSCTGVSVYMSDITARRRAEQEVERSEALRRAAVEASGVAFWELDPQSNEICWSDQARELFGVVPGEESFDLAWTRIHPEDRERVAEALQRAVDPAGDGAYRVDFRIIRPHGSTLWVESRGRTSFEQTPAGGRATRIRGAMLDVTESREVERALRENEERLRRVLRASPVPMILYASDGEVLHVSSSVTDQTGYEADQLRDIHVWLRLAYRERADEVWERVRQLMEVEGALPPTEFPLWIRSGEQRTILVSSAHVGRLPDGRRVRLAAWQDITEQKRVQEALGESVERFHTLADNMSQFAWMADASGWIFWYNKRWYEFTGTTLDEMEGWGWRKVHHPDHVGRVVEKISRCFETGEAWEDIFPLRRKDGGYRWFLSRAIPIRDAEGSVIRWFGTNTDVTEQREAEEELRRANERLEQRVRVRTAELRRRAEQLARLTSELTLVEHRERRRIAQVLHDHIQQILMAARMRLELIARDLAGADSATVRSVSTMLDEALCASQSLSVELSPPVLHEVGLAAGLEWLARRMGETHGLVVDLTTDERAATEREDVRILLFQSVREALFNIVKHAGVGRARVELAPHGDDYLRVTIADDGKGFDPSEAGLTGARGAGGLGLFSIRERLTRLGGHMEVDSAVGRGTRLELIAPLRVLYAERSDRDGDEPRTEITVPTAGAGVVASEVADGPIRVLLADDHPVVRKALAALLRDEPDIEIVGEVSDGRAAVESAGQLLPDVILMDFSMPEMDGIEATRLIHSKLPRIRIIGLSMYPEVDRSAAMMDAGADAYISKREKPDALLRAIRRVVTQRA